MDARGAWRLVLPLALAQTLFFLAPLLLLAATSFSTDENLAAISAQAWGDVLGDAFQLRAVWNTMRLGLLTVLATTLLAVPLALLHMAAGPGLKRLILLAAVLPLLTSVVVRTFAWIAILGREGLINNALLSTGLVSTPVPLLQTEHGLILALTQIEMPLMLLPLIAATGRIDPALLDASSALGASLFRTLRRVVLPLALRQALPTYGNELILMVKATSLASIITLMEITGIAAKLIAQSYRTVEVFAVAGAIYLVINFVLTRLVHALERRLDPGRPPALAAAIGKGGTA